jgi:hypothetical protein
MKAFTKDLNTGKTIEVEIPDENLEALQALTQDRVSDTKLQSYIDNLDLPADAKALIASILTTAVRVGEMVIRIGKKIVEIVIMIVSKFPNATFGLVLGLIVGALVTSIPLIGGLLGAFVLPIAAAFGLATGYMDDLRDNSLAKKVAEVSAMFQPLKSDANVVS